MKNLTCNVEEFRMSHSDQQSTTVAAQYTLTTISYDKLLYKLTVNSMYKLTIFSMFHNSLTSKFRLLVLISIFDSKIFKFFKKQLLAV